MNSKRQKIGLALSGGAARGFAHAGVLKVLAEHNIPIDMIAGTSAGSLVAGAFAAGMRPDEIANMGRGLRWLSISAFSFSLKGLFSNKKLGRFIAQNFPAQRFEDVRIPFGAVACNIETGEEIVINTGDLATAIRASCAVPGVFTPVIGENGQTLVDGGVVAPVPTRAVRAMGADIVIAVDVLASGSAKLRNPRSAFGVVFQSGIMLLRTASRLQDDHADMTIVPEVGHIPIHDLTKMEELFTLGQESALEKIDDIKEMIGP